MLKSQPFNVVIIGAGKIGAFFDTPESSGILTHAHAFTADPAFRLLGFMDVDVDQAARAAAIWGGRAFADLSQIFQNSTRVDVAVVAVPDQWHAGVFQELVGHPVKLIFMEKPLASTLDDAHRMADLCQKKSLSVLLNYSRRFVPEFQRLRLQISARSLGNFVTGSAYYGKGIVHNGSHMIDLLRYLIGDIHDFTCVTAVRDFSEVDPSVSAVLRFSGDQTLFLQAVDSRLVSVFEADLFFEKGRIRILDSGFLIEESEIGDSPVYPGYRILSNVYSLPSSLDQALKFAVRNIAGHLNSKEDLRCDVNEGLTTLELCLKIADGAQAL